MPKRKDAFIPNTPDELTAAWVADAFAGAGVGGTVRDIEVRPLGGGVGMTGQTVRVRIDGDDTPASAVAKFAASQAQTRGITESYDSYAREIRFYQRYADRIPVRTPAYLGADYDPGCLVFDEGSTSHSAGGNPARFEMGGGIRPADERWRKNLTEAELEVFEKIAGSSNRAFGYD